ncbi:hypothetical protein EON65_18820 [archaeon]|nr:MAG: hypothetical protein EON65_18820 [archaeon]
MLRQSDPNWIAYFFITDHYPLSTKLKAILSSYNDTRLQFLHISKTYRPKVSAFHIHIHIQKWPSPQQETII